MKLIVGLGNPGRAYKDLRHNIGFRVLKSLSKNYRIALKRSIDTYSLSGKGRIDGKEVILAQPFTFMNLSGIAVVALVKKNKLDLDNLLIICDDLDLELGRFRIRGSGSSGGHRGLKSIIDYLGSQNFSRLRIGIGRPRGNLDAAEYVLSPFTKKENESVNSIVEKASECCLVWIREGINKAMNICNKKELIQ